MTIALQMLNQLEGRRRRLGMSQSALAKRCGLSVPTVQRVLAGNLEQASFGNVLAIADALGMSAVMKPVKSEDELREEQAEKKARQLIGMVQGTSGLESQAVSHEEFEAMVRRTVHELLADPGRKLWAA
ncbi:MAG: helix-turn-helix domain-containing protein [Pirellulaceae bacterium]